MRDKDEERRKRRRDGENYGQSSGCDRFRFQAQINLIETELIVESAHRVQRRVFSPSSVNFDM